MKIQYIYCITETQQKLENVNIPESLTHIYSHRNIDDRKGGGLSIMFKRNINIDIKKSEVKHKDILKVTCNINGRKMHIILVYMSTNDQERNRIIAKSIETEMKNIR